MDRKLIFILFTVICGCHLVMTVSRRLAAFEKVIEEVRPYLQQRQLRHEDAYDIDRRMLSEAFRRAIGDDRLKLDVEMEQNFRASEAFIDTQAKNMALRRSLDDNPDFKTGERKQNKKNQQIVVDHRTAENRNAYSQNKFGSTTLNQPIVSHKETNNYELTLPNVQSYDAKELYGANRYGAFKGKNNGVAARQVENTGNSTWREWLIKHPNIYLYASKTVPSDDVRKVTNKSNSDAMLGLPMSTFLSKSNKLRGLNGISGQGEIQMNISLAMDKQLHADNTAQNSEGNNDKNLLSLPSHFVNTTWNRRPAKNEPDYIDEYYLDYSGIDGPDYIDGEDPKLSAINMPCDQKLYDFQSNGMQQEDVKSKEKRGPIWNNFPISNSDRYDYNYKSKIYKPPEIAGIDPYLMGSIIPMNTAFDLPPNIPQSLRVEETTTMGPNNPLFQFSSAYSSLKLTPGQKAITNDNAHDNDQIDTNQNDLSHEANYKLSKLEQDNAALERKNHFWNTYNLRHNNRGLRRRWEKN